MTTLRTLWILSLIVTFSLALNENAEFWKQNGHQTLMKNLNLKLNENVAKNIILFIGDGMGIPTITATRHLKELLKNESSLSFEEFPHVSASKTYCVDEMIPDSACTASAIYSGVKTSYGTYGYDYKVVREDTESVNEGNEVSTILKWAQEAGKATGFVTTARVTHATPGALYAHTVDRDYECDSKIGSNKVKDIAWQLVHQDPGDKINVIMGGGRPAFFPIKIYQDKYGNESRPEYWSCPRLDGANLVQEWLDQRSNAEYVDNVEDLNKVQDAEYLMGLFAEYHIPYLDQRDSNVHPSLNQMTSKAIEILSKNDNGFFLMVEAARIDSGHHENWAVRALNEALEFDETIEETLKTINLEETLVIVTADHSHTMSLSGYAKRGSDVRGLGKDLADDNLPYTLMSYANGPSFYKFYQGSTSGNVSRLDLSNKTDFNDPAWSYPSGVLKGDESHGGEEVLVFAHGPWSHLFQGVHEESYIAYVMSYSACIGPTKDLCSSKHEQEDQDQTLVFVQGIRTLPSIWFFVFIAFLLAIFYCTSNKSSSSRNDYDQV